MFGTAVDVLYSKHGKHCCQTAVDELSSIVTLHDVRLKLKLDKEFIDEPCHVRLYLESELLGPHPGEYIEM